MNANSDDLAAENALLKLENAAAKAEIASLRRELAELSQQQKPAASSASDGGAAATSSEDDGLLQRLEDARSTLAGALQGLAADEECDLPAPALAETTQARLHHAGPDVSRLEAELRCLLASLRHADRELRTARSAIAEGSHAPPQRLQRSRSLDREELQSQLVQAKVRAAQLELERDEHQMAVRRLTQRQLSTAEALAPAATQSKLPRRRKTAPPRALDAAP